MQQRKRQHSSSFPIPRVREAPHSSVTTTFSGTYSETQHLAQQQVLQAVLRRTSLAELRDREIVNWLTETERWLQNPGFSESELSELRLLVLGVLHTMPWWRIIEAVDPFRDQRGGNQKSTFGSANASVAATIKGITRWHERLQLSFEAVCLRLIEQSPRIVPSVLEVVLKPFSLRPLVQDGALRAIPADSIVRILNIIAIKLPASEVLSLFERCLQTLVPKQRWANRRHHVVCTAILLYLALEGQTPVYHPSYGNCQCLTRAQELFEIALPSTNATDVASSLLEATTSFPLRHANTAGRAESYISDCEARGGGNSTARGSSLSTMAQALSVPVSSVSTSPVSLGCNNNEYNLTGTRRFTRLEREVRESGMKKKMGTLQEKDSEVPPVLLPQSRRLCHEQESCVELSTLAEYDSASSCAVLKAPVRNALADFSDVEVVSHSSSNDTRSRSSANRSFVDVPNASPLFQHNHTPLGFDGDGDGATPRDIATRITTPCTAHLLLSETYVLSHGVTGAAPSSAVVVQSASQNNRMLAYRNEIIRFVVKRLEEMELTLDHPEGEEVAGTSRSICYSKQLQGFSGQCEGGPLPSSPSTTQAVEGVLSDGLRISQHGSCARVGGEKQQLNDVTAVASPANAGRITGSSLVSAVGASKLVSDIERPFFDIIKDCCTLVFYMLAEDLRRQQAAGVCGNVDWWRELLGFHFHLMVSSAERSLCLQYIAPSIAMLGQGGEAVDMLHKVVTLVTKGCMPSTLNSASMCSSVAAAFGSCTLPSYDFGHVLALPGKSSLSTGSGPMQLRMAAPPAMASSQSLSVQKRLRAALTIFPLFKFMKDRIGNGEDIRKRLLKWVVKELRSIAATATSAARSGGTGMPRLVEVVFVQCAAISELMGMSLMPANLPVAHGDVTGGQPPLPFFMAAGSVVVDNNMAALLQPLLAKYVINNASGVSNKQQRQGEGEREQADTDKSLSTDRGSSRKTGVNAHGSNGRSSDEALVRLDMAQLTLDGLLQPSLMDACPWAELLRHLLSSGS